MRRLAVALGLLAAARVSRAQAPAALRASVEPDTSWHVWATLALGPGAANGADRASGDIAVWFTRDRLAIWVRDAGDSRLFESGDFWDVSVLAGVHPRSERHVDLIAGAGVGISRGHGTGGENLPSRPALAAGAQVNWNYRVVGIGIDGFATVSSGRQYYGVGLAVGIGAFR